MADDGLGSRNFGLKTTFMDSQHQLRGGGEATEPSSVVSAQPSSAATTLFPFLEADLPALLGYPAEKIAAARRGLDHGTDWSRISRAFRWSEAGVKRLAAALGGPVIASDTQTLAPTTPSEKTAPAGELAAPGTVRRMRVCNLNIPNQRLILCKDEQGVGASVFINPTWRPLFRPGMWIEATRGTSGGWRTRRPRSVGKF